MQASPEAIQARKERLLKLARLVNQVAEEENGHDVLNLLKKEPVCNKRVITKYARVVKDPDPIATTQLLMGQKFPILAKKSYLRYYTEAEREELFSNDDCRRVGWVKCSRKAIDLWISKGKPLTEEQRQIIKVLYESSIEMAKDFYSRAWDRATVTYGRVPLERQSVATRNVLVNVPREYRQKAVVEIVQPGYNLNQPEVKIYVQQILEKIGQRIVTGMSIVDQARILMNSLDPKRRILPVALSLHGELAQHSIAYYGNNWMITQLPGRTYSTPGDTYDMRRICAFILSRISKLELNRKREALGRLKRGKEPFIETIKKTPEDYAVKVIKSIMRLPCSRKHDYFGTEMIVSKKGPNTEVVTHPSGIQWREYIDEEKIYFRHLECRGWFTHNRATLTEITFSITDRITFENLLVNIANYIRYDWVYRPGKSIKELRDLTMLEVKKEPWKILGTNKRVWEEYWRHIEDSLITITDEMKNYLTFESKVNVRCVYKTEIPEETEVHYEVRPDGSLEEIDGNSRIPYIEIKTAGIPHLDMTWNSNDMYIIPLLHPQISMMRTIEFHLLRPNLEEDIMKNNFSTHNAHCPYWLEAASMAGFCNQARMMLYGAMFKLKTIPKIFLAYLYCFSGYPRAHTKYNERARMKTGGFLDLYAKDGNFRRDPETGKWLIFDKEWVGVVTDMGPEPELLAYTFLNGFRLESVKKRKGDHGLANLREGMEALKEKQDGEMIYVRIGGDVKLLVRDRTTDAKRALAIKRGRERVLEDRELELMSSLQPKRAKKE
ncbi:polymerase basic 2 protein [Wellfleet Bay virus]|uniref:Polymerase basic 2 protein n=1 Tax=Wellfleet Bay virus TaxID=1566309 RepID=A0A0A1E755_9ORTO|nr:polymerase basic 2 protein [Wellfleet Bay virus]AIY25029.1 polymerase basic 2 protein [Wellfleet Bay virus]